MRVFYMKKITFFLTFGILMMNCVNSSHADSYKYTPYVGAGYAYNHTTAEHKSPKTHIGSVYIGSDYSEYFSTEIFFNQSTAEKNYPSGHKTKTSYRAYGLDLTAYLPLGCEKRFSLLASAGIGEYVFKQKTYPYKHHNEHGWGYRFGGGFKYAFDTNWQAKFMTRYINFDRVYGYDHAVEYFVGIEYHFNEIG